MTELTRTIHHTTKKKNSHHYTAGIYITHVALRRAASGCIRKRYVANLLYHDNFGHLNATHNAGERNWSRNAFRNEAVEALDCKTVGFFSQNQ